MLVFFQNNPPDGLSRVEKKKFRSKQRIIKNLFLHGKSDCNSIARQIHLSAPSTQAFINELIKDGIIVEKGYGNSSGGRPPIVFGLAAKLFYILCVDVDRFHVRLSILDSNLELIRGIDTHEVRFQDNPQ